MNEGRVAIVAGGRAFSYGDLERASRRVATALLGDRDDLDQARVAFLVQPGFDYVAVQRGIWRAGGVAVPLATSHPPPELEYVIRDAGAAFVVGEPASAGVLAPLAAAEGAWFLSTAELLGPERADLPASARGASTRPPGRSAKADRPASAGSSGRTATQHRRRPKRTRRVLKIRLHRMW